jgi:hypothetical protein
MVKPFYFISEKLTSEGVNCGITATFFFHTCLIIREGQNVVLLEIRIGALVFVIG